MRLRNTKPDPGKIRFQSAIGIKTQLFQKTRRFFPLGPSCPTCTISLHPYYSSALQRAKASRVILVCRWSPFTTLVLRWSPLT